MPYLNWDSQQKKLVLTAFVAPEKIIRTLNVCLGESFATKEGRLAIRSHLYNMVTFDRILLDKNTRFPENGQFVDTNDMKIYLQLHKLYECLDFMGEEEQRLYSGPKTSYYAGMKVLRQYLMMNEDSNDVACGDSKGLGDPKKHTEAVPGRRFFDRSYFEEYYGLEWVNN
ncbi:hypothetical protein O0L34_g170 [Tuta absoluta]|nr:hypothetical protein O0L34_g170 [Tuta absoluta]